MFTRDKKISNVAHSCVVVLAFMANVGSAHAKNTDTDKARVVFQEGVERYNAGDYEKALEAFHEADEIWHTWKLDFNIGQCQAVLKHYGLAIEAFERYLAEGGDDVPTNRRDEVLAELDRLRKMVGSLDVEAPSGAVVIVDGVERGRTPLPGRIRVVSGKNHEVLVKLEEKVLVERTVRIGGGESFTIRARSATPPAEAPADSPAKEEEPKEAPREKSKVLLVLFWVGAGLTVVTGGIGIGSYAAAGARSDDYEKMNDEVAAGDLPPDDKELIAARDDVEAYDKLSMGMLVTAGALAVGTAVVGIVYLVKNKEDDADVAVTPGGIAVRF